MPFTTTKPVGLFTDINGKPLDGQVFFGQPNLDPIANPITVYWDAAGTQPVTQPVVTVGGYPMNGSTRSNVFVNADYSILVRNRNGFTVFSAPNLPFEDSSDNQYFLQAGSGAVQRTVQSKLRDVVSVKDFGAVGDGVADDTAAIQAALDASKGVYFPQGTYKIISSLNMSSDNYVFGSGRSSVIQSTHNGAIFKGKNVTPASGTNVRVYRGGGADLYLIGPGSGLGASIGLDMRGCSQFKWYNIGIQDVNSGVVQGDGYSTYYNEYYATDIANVVFGYYNTQLANENTVFGGRILNSTIGTQDSDNSHNKYIGVAVEGWITAGHKVAAPAAQYISFISSRLENAGGTGIVIDATAQATYILAPAFQSLSTNINNSGDGTTVVSEVNWTINSGTTITKHQSITATLDFSSISANTSQDIFVANTGSTVNDSVFVTPNPSVAANLMFMAIPATGGVYVRCANVSTGAIDPASQSFRIDIWRHA